MFFCRATPTNRWFDKSEIFTAWKASNSSVVWEQIGMSSIMRMDLFKSKESAPIQEPEMARSLVWDYHEKISSANVSCNACISILKQPMVLRMALV